MGLEEAEVRRSWAGFRYGRWTIASLLSDWFAHVEEQGQWQAHRYDGYRVKAADVTAFWRSALAWLQSQHYDAEAGKSFASCAIGPDWSGGECRGAAICAIDRHCPC